jgi:sodium/proline symporter
MSAWVLMGLPGAIFAFGMGRVWIAIGLAAGYITSWILLAPRLRKFSIAANDSITIPQYLTNRFLSNSKVLQIICAVIFLIAYTVYAASSIKACGILFNTVLGINATIAMYAAAFIIISYTMLGGFKAVCWTDFFQGMIMLGAILITPIIALFMLNAGAVSMPSAVLPENFWNFLRSGSLDWKSWSDILSGFGWGLGYFGMPHIIIRYMAIRSQREVKKAAVVAVSWNIIILVFAVAVGIIGRMVLDITVENRERVFIEMVRLIFPGALGVISGLMLSAILSAAMSTADSQLLASASSFAADVYKPIIRKGKADDNEMFWAGRIVVAVIAIVALFIAASPKSGTIMGLVENAWGIFGAAFGPVILLSVFWKRFNFTGAVAGIVTGAVVDILWLALFSRTGLYEIIPGFIAGAIVAVIVTLYSKKPSAEVEALFDKSITLTD